MMDLDEETRMSETSSVRGRRRIMSPMSSTGIPDAENATTMRVRPRLRCNTCWEPLLSNPQCSQTCYRTTCNHVFCEKCAYKYFGSGRLICAACRTDLTNVTMHGIKDNKRIEAIWEEMIADPSSCFNQLQQALDFVLYQLAQDASRQEDVTKRMEEEQKAFQVQHGEKYIQLKNYADQLEADLRETVTKMESLTTSNEELREAYKEKSRKCKNWEKMCKALKAKNSNNHHSYSPSNNQHPMENSMSIYEHENASQASHFQQGIGVFRDKVRPTSLLEINSKHPSMGHGLLSRPSGYCRPDSIQPDLRMHRPETPGTHRQFTQTGNPFGRFSRPQLGRPIQNMQVSRPSMLRPTTPLHTHNRNNFILKRPVYHR